MPTCYIKIIGCIDTRINFRKWIFPSEEKAAHYFIYDFRSFQYYTNDNNNNVNFILIWQLNCVSIWSLLTTDNN